MLTLRINKSPAAPGAPLSSTSTSDESPKKRHTTFPILCALFFVFLFLFLYTINTHLGDVKGLSSAQDLLLQLESSKTQFETLKIQHEQENREHAKSHVVLETQVHSLEKQLTDSQTEIASLEKRLTRMQQSISARSLHRCKNETNRVLMITSQGNIEFELAPCSVMPVVTEFLLEKIREGFWRGMTFFRAESHVIQATRQRKDGSHPKFDKLLDSIPFQEYSKEFPHHKFTLGLAGRPGGTDFYVNMQENVKIHGPGGQSHNYKDQTADSCFARIVSGENVAVKIQSLPFKRENGMHILKEPVEIIDMKLLE